MERMNYNKQRQELIQNDKHFKNILNSISVTKPITVTITEIAAKINTNGERTLSVEESAKEIKDYVASEIEAYTGTNTSYTSSTDSGVNISDNDEIPSSPLISNPSTDGAVNVNPFNKQFLRDTSPDKNLNKNSNNSHICNDIVYDGCGDDECNSTNFDNELNSRMQDHQDNCTRYGENETVIESEKAINVSHHRNLKDAAATITGNAVTVVETINGTGGGDVPSLEHNEDISRQEQLTSTPSSPSPSSSLSISSVISSEIIPSLKGHNDNSSPVVSIRSICSSVIITSDSDSDTDLNSDIEGVHENYVIKELGNKVTYPPNHSAIPNINSAHTLLNQQVTTSNGQQQPSPLAALAALGDSFGPAQALGAVPSVSGIVQRPQIGSIALNNSSDVTFGDKHFYEGPVTIQQFLIDRRDKRKDNDGNDNPAFTIDNPETPNNAKDINSSTTKSDKLYGYISKHKKIFIPGVLTVMALIVVGIILAVIQNDGKSKLIVENSEESRKNIPINSTIDTNSTHIDTDDDECPSNGTLCLIERDVWRAHPERNTLDKQKLPLHRVIISHTATQACDSLKICIERVRIIQEFHMNSQGWDDIGYNFLISSDGHVYVGRGWDAVGAHTKGYNFDSVGISFIGTYMFTPPTEAQLNACLALLDEGLKLNKLADNYHIYGARQFQSTESPGDILYKRIKKWKRWSANINPN